MSIIIFTYSENYLDNLKQEAKKISNVSPLKPQSLILHAKVMTWEKQFFEYSFNTLFCKYDHL